MADIIRQKRLASFIQNKIGAMLTLGVIKDPRLHSFLMINDVVVAKDLASAKVYVSSFDSKEVHKDVINTLNNAAGFIQKELGRELKIRVTPKLRFHADYSVRDGFQVINKIQKIQEPEISDLDDTK